MSKWDIIILVFVLFLLVILSVDCFAFSSELVGNYKGSWNGVLTSSSSWYLYRIPIEDGVVYTFARSNFGSSTSSIYIMVGDEFSDGSIYNVSNILSWSYSASYDTYSLDCSDYSDYSYVYYSYDFNHYTLSVSSNVTGMSSSVSSLVSFVSFSSLWEVFGSAIPYVLVVVLFVFGFYIIFRMIAKLQHGKNY